MERAGTPKVLKYKHVLKPIGVVMRLTSVKKTIEGRRLNKGFTLIDLLTTLAIFGVLSLSILSTVVITNGYWQNGNQQTTSQSNSRVGFQTILNELKQALPDPDRGNPATGYLSIIPAVSPTGVLMPNANTTTSTTLIFTEPNTINYTPFVVGWNPANPSNYKRIQYTVSGGTNLQRTETTYNNNGSVAGTRTDQILASKNGTLQIQTRYITSNLFNLSVTATENGKTYVLSSNVYLEEQ